MSGSGPENDHVVPGVADNRKRRGRLLIWLLSALLVLALIIIAVLVLSPKSTTDQSQPATNATNSAAPKRTQTPSAAPTHSGSVPSRPPMKEPSAKTPPAPPAPPAPPKAPASATIEYFDASTTVIYCNTLAPVIHDQYLTFWWSATNASSVGFGIETNDAISAGMGWDLPLKGSSEFDFPSSYSPYVYPCPQASQSYTLTVEGPSGRVSRTVTVTNKGDTE